MSTTTASPRPSLALSSRRNSTSTSHSPAPRRNRAALRDYYNLQQQPGLAPEVDELDRPDFNAETYVHNLLSRAGLEGVLRVEAGLVGAIRSLEGEKKALVYDNYSKLIAATVTIRRMREPWGKGEEVVRGVEEIAGMAGRLRKGGLGNERGGEKETVRWVLGAPGRLRGLVERGQREEAERQWRVVEGLLGKWEGVGGVKEVRQACREVMGDANG